MKTAKTANRALPLTQQKMSTVCADKVVVTEWCTSGVSIIPDTAIVRVLQIVPGLDPVEVLHEDLPAAATYAQIFCTHRRWCNRALLNNMVLGTRSRYLTHVPLTDFFGVEQK